MNVIFLSITNRYFRIPFNTNTNSIIQILTTMSLITTSTEDLYLRAIYLLSHQEDEETSVSTNALATVMATTPASVTDMLKKLTAKSLIYYRPYYGVKLTEKGLQIALQLLHRQSVWAQFLEAELQLPQAEIETLAPQLAVIRDEKLIQSLTALIGIESPQSHALAS
jgi:DtxR family Mn-dependent transcriptional regulator